MPIDRGMEINGANLSKLLEELGDKPPSTEEGENLLALLQKWWSPGLGSTLSFEQQQILRRVNGRVAVVVEALQQENGPRAVEFWSGVLKHMQTLRKSMSH